MIMHGWKNDRFLYFRTDTLVAAGKPLDSGLVSIKWTDGVPLCNYSVGTPVEQLKIESRLRPLVSEVTDGYTRFVVRVHGL